MGRLVGSGGGRLVQPGPPVTRREVFQCLGAIAAFLLSLLGFHWLIRWLGNEKEPEKELKVTVKKDLVQDGRMYRFGDPTFIGKSYHYDEETDTIWLLRDSSRPDLKPMPVEQIT